MSQALVADTGAESIRADSRVRVLQVLRDSAAGCGVTQIAARTGLHPNTVRFHLERLKKNGLVSREIRRRGEPGRPPLTYTATPRPDARQGQREFGQLAEVLAGIVAQTADDSAVVATEAGRAWGVGLTHDRHAAAGGTTTPEALSVLVETLAEIGFAPELSVTGDHATLVQRHCPFLEVAERHQDVVCSVHLGFMRGVLEQLNAPVVADRLVPFASAKGCEAHLASGHSPSGD